MFDKAQPDSLKKDDIYEKVETREGTTEQQKETGRSVYTDRLKLHARWAGGSLLGSNLSRDFREKGGSVLLGKRVRSARDLAVLAQVLRDPRFETFRVFYTQKDRIVHHTAISSRLPGAVFLSDWIADYIKSTWERAQADGYWLLHNHPSGISTPSLSDLALTAQYNTRIPGFRGHTVIDTNEYSVIYQNGEVERFCDVAGLVGGYENNPYKDHAALDRIITSPFELAQVGQLLKLPDQHLVLIGISSPGRVCAIGEVPLSILERSDHLLHGHLRRFARNSGIASVFAVTDRSNVRHSKLISAVEHGVLRDVIAMNGSEKAFTLCEEGYVHFRGHQDSLFGKIRTGAITEDGGWINLRGRGR
ncbi:JAB domain-containing protein [Nitrosomonas sp. Is37]|uniref:JAB domain-containing protein n=1 Tax=Nitrosomonas sp. Is37 TaxID=3080535 RepID=UPI00294AD5C9|nr:DNA repair protein RadC [Nitrosomonas sp. Is37]MDV6344761.1 DNA repair protein RadC [Nitrosomonas sp. Is37]